METQYLDFLNIKHIKMSKEKRLKNFTSLARRITEYYIESDYQEISEVVREAAEEYGCPKSEIKLQGMEYPEDFQW